MATEVIMPKAGMAMEEGTIMKWFKKPGDKVEAGEALLEIITDKVNMEVEAEVSGSLLQILAQEGDVLPVFSVIAYIGQEGEKLGQKENEKVRATPAARFEARQSGTDLKDIRGTGPKGRIQKDDVLNYLDKAQEKVKISPLAQKIVEEKGQDISQIQGSGHRGKIMAEDVLSYGQVAKEQEPAIENINSAKAYEDQAMSPVQKTIAKKMTESYFTSPVFSLEVEVDMKNSLEALESIKTSLNEEGVKLTISDLLIMAVSKALIKHKSINASLIEDKIRRYKTTNIALAVGIEDGLIVPVLKNVQDMGLGQIGRKRKELVEKARSNSLQLDELEGSSFTISNLGMYGIKSFTSIINQPNAAILSVGMIKDTVVAHEGQVVVRPIMNMTLTLDHRLTDGVGGAKFLESLKNNLENPLNMLI